MPDIDFVKKFITIQKYAPISFREANEMDLEEFEIMYSVCLGISIKENREHQKQMANVPSIKGAVR